MKIYVAAASADIVRAETAMGQLTAAGLHVTSTWPSVIRRVGDANPMQATRTQQRSWAQADVDEVQAARALWLLMPHRLISQGAFFELGYAMALGRLTIISGPGQNVSIFTGLSHETFETDEAALAWIIDRLGVHAIPL